MTLILAIDPGNTQSAYVVLQHDTRRPVEFDKISNHALLGRLSCIAEEHELSAIAIEMVASYGMPVGADVFETCVWIGRFTQHADGFYHQPPVDLVKRQPVKLHHCHSSKATDANISQALKDRFAPGERNHGKGTKADPGWFYGFAADVWQAYALAVYVADTTPIPSPADASSPVRAAGEARAEEVLVP